MRNWFTLRRIMVVVAILAVGLGGWAASTSSAQPPKAIASWLIIELPRPGRGVAGESDRQLWLAAYRKTQAALVSSPNVLSAAVEGLRSQRPHLVADKADPVAWLQAGIQVDDLADSLLTVSMPGAAREDQAVIVNAVTDAYFDATHGWESGRHQERIQEADLALADHRRELAAKRKRLREAKDDDPEQLAELRDEINILEEMTRRLGMGSEQARLEARESLTIRLIAAARP